MSFYILKEGNLPNVWYAECDNCGSVIKYHNKNDEISQNKNKHIDCYRCIYCKDPVVFYRENTVMGKKIYRNYIDDKEKIKKRVYNNE